MHKTLLAVIFILITSVVSSQEFNAGLYAGFSATQIDGDSYGGYNKPGFSMGGFVNREVIPKVDGQLGLRYIQKGSRKSTNEQGDGTFSDYKASLHYLEMPVTARYHHYEKVDFEAGFTVGYIVKAYEEFNKDGAQESTTSFDRFEVGGIAGINYKLSDNLLAGGFFQYSWLPIRPYNTRPGWLFERGQHNNVLLFTLTYTIKAFR